MDAESYAEQIDAMAARWRDRLGRVRARSSTDLLLKVLPGVPLVSVKSASTLIGRSNARTTDAINACAEVGILRQRNVTRQRYRVFEATDVLDLFAGLERSLASPSGDTLADPPVRHVPARPHRPGPVNRRLSNEDDE